MSGQRWVERLAIPLGFALTVAVLAVVFFYPVGSVFVEAIWRTGAPTLGPIVGVLTDPFYIDLFRFTAYQALLSTVASVLLGLPGAYLLARYEFPGRQTLRSLTILPFVLPAIMVAVGFVAMFGTSGFLNDLLGAVGLGPIHLMYTLQIILLAHAFYNAPLVTRLVATAWESVDVRRVETARAMGASRARAFRDVILPQLLPALLTAALLTFIFTFMSFPIVLALGGLQLATVEVWIYARVQALDLADAATLATLETALSLLLLYVYLRFEARQTADNSGGPSLPRRALLDGWQTLTDFPRMALLGYCLVGLVVFVGPLVSLVIESVTGPNGHLTLAYYQFLLSRQTATAAGTTKPLPAVVNSLVYGVGTLLIAVPMGVVVAVVATRDLPGSRLAEAILTAPLAVSGVVVGIGLLQTFVFGTVLFGYRFTVVGPLAIVLAHSVAAYPFVTRNVAPALGSIDHRLVDAAQSLGATRARVLLDVELPLIGAALTAGAAFAFAISIGEFDSTVLLASNTGSYTMPVALQRYIGNRSVGPSLGPATAMGTVLLVITAASFLVIDRLGGRWDL
ncbi:MAG: ABC transporter permease [Halorientalis sp.]